MSEPQDLLAGRYRLIRVLATGGMGVVWEGRDERLERAVAIKQLLTQPGASQEEAEVAKDRAMREARITARLHHPHAVPVFDAVEHEGRPCLIMPLLPSTPLSTVLRERGRLPLADVAVIGTEVASALAAAHALGIVHRDVKPGNILMTADGAAHISDFGISHAMGDATLTRTGMVHGTPMYLAPEVARGRESTFASDVFSLGSTLYAALEGEPPFGSESNAIALLHRVATADVPPSSRAGRLAPFLLTMLARDPEARPTMGAVASHLAGIRAAAQPAEQTLPLGPPAAVTTMPPSSATEARETQALEPVTGSMEAAPTDGMSAEAVTPVLLTPEPEPEPETEAAEDPGSGWEAVIGTAPTVAGSSAPAAARRGPARGRRRALVPMLVGAAVVAVLVFIGVTLGGPSDDDSPRTAGDPGAAPTVPSDVGTPSPETSSVDPSPGSEPVPEPEPAPEPEPTPEPEPAPEAEPPAEPEPEPTSEPVPEPPAPEPAAADQATELVSAITGYYALMPTDTDAAWPRMTADYQANHAGGRGSYEDFWDEIGDVTVSDVQATPPDRAEATLTYYYADGRVRIERTAFRLAQEGGSWKIASSEVLTSRSG